MDTLFYDSRCPLCLREVRILKKLSGDGLALADIHSSADQPGEPTQLLKLTVLHLKTAQGEWLTGVDATVRAWSHTRFGFLFKTLRWPLIGVLADWCYGIWARRRYTRLYGCVDCQES
jgi:predicted DCC family thiol-disulfide oxidoreductase YuxK